MKKTPPILPTYYKSLGTKIFRDTTALPFADGGPLNDRNIKGDLLPSVYASALGNYYSNGGKFFTTGNEYHRVYKNAEGNIMVNHPKEDKGKWDTINLTEKSGANTISEGVDATKQWHAENPNTYANGGMIKRADGSYSKRGLWDNIRANAGSGKEPTKEMLAQERKINNSYAEGGQLGPGDCGPGLRWDDATQSCVPILKVANEDDPRYQEYLERKRLYEYSQLPAKIKRFQTDDLLEGYSAKSEYPFNSKTAYDTWKEALGSVDDLEGAYGSVANKKILSLEEFENWKKSIDPSLIDYAPEFGELLTKYPPSKYEIREQEVGWPFNSFITVDSKGKYTKPETNFLEDKINREELRKIYPKITDAEIDEWIQTNRTTPNYITNIKDPKTGTSQWIAPGTYETRDYGEGIIEKEFVPTIYENSLPPSSFVDPTTGVRGYYPDYLSQQFGKNYSYYPIWDNPIPVEIETPPVVPTAKETPVEEFTGPQYNTPGYKMSLPSYYLAHHNSSQLIPHARLTRSIQDNVVTRPGAKLVQKITGYDPAAMEGYYNEEGEFVPGEIARAQEEGRRINFQGANSLEDRRAQKEYNALYDAYEKEQQLKGMYPIYIPTKEHAQGGQLKPDYSLPEDSFQQGGRNLKNSVYASSMGQYPANYAEGGAMNQDPPGGPIYTYKGRPGSYYQKDSKGKWYISNKGTGGNYIPIDDPSGQRTAVLNKSAVVAMANPTAPKQDYSKVTPSYSKSGMVQSVAGKTEAERQPVKNEIEGQQFAQKMEQDYADATKNQLPQHEQPLDMMDYAWQAAAGLPTGLKAVGQLAKLTIPYTGMTVGTAANTAAGIHGATQIPSRVQDWQNVSAGKMDYRDALLNTGLTSLELYGGYNAGKTLLPQTYKINPLATRLKEYNRVVGEDAIVDMQNSGVVRSGNSGGVNTNIGKRTTPYPSFGKGKPSQVYVNQTIEQGKTPYIISTDRPMAVSTLGRHGKGTTQFPIDKAGNYIKAIPEEEVTVFNAKPHWLKGYQEIPRTMQPSVTIDPTTGLKQYGNTTLMNYVNLPVKRSLNARYADASLLPEDQIPYLLPKEELIERYPWQYMSKDQEILESFKSNIKVPQRPTEIPASHTTQEDIMARALGKPLPTRVSKASLEPKIYYDLNGNIIKKPQ